MYKRQVGDGKCHQACIGLPLVLGRQDRVPLGGKQALQDLLDGLGRIHVTGFRKIFIAPLRGGLSVLSIWVGLRVVIDSSAAMMFAPTPPQLRKEKPDKENPRRNCR